MNKKAQLTIFVILAIIIVAALAIVFYPKIHDFIIPKTPAELLPASCVEHNVREALNYTMQRGGNANPQLYYMYNNFTLDYLCYTGEWYKTCTMQRPLLKQEIEKEVSKMTAKSNEQCINDMVQILTKQGYNVKLTGNKNAQIDISLNKIIVTFNLTMDLEKDTEKLSFAPSQFKTQIDSKAYNLIMIANSIQNYEARYGDSETTAYMDFYPSIKVEKYKQSDGTKVYILTERNTAERLQFAIRSLSWPAGYAITPQNSPVGAA